MEDLFIFFQGTSLLSCWNFDLITHFHCADVEFIRSQIRIMNFAIHGTFKCKFEKQTSKILDVYIHITYSEHGQNIFQIQYQKRSQYAVLVRKKIMIRGFFDPQISIHGS